MSAPQAALKVHAHERDDGLESKQIKGFSKSSKFFVRVAIMVGILIAPLIVDTASGRARVGMRHLRLGWLHDQPRSHEGRLEGPQQRQRTGRFESVADRAGFTPWSSSKFPKHRRNPWVVYSG